MGRYAKPAEGSWTEHYPQLGTGPMSTEDSISPEFYELEREAIFRKAWLNVGRVEELPRNGSFFTKELAVVNTSVIITRDLNGEIHAFHNVCRHRGNKLAWTDYPGEESAGTAASSPASTTCGTSTSTAPLSYVPQEEEFFDLDKATLAWCRCTATSGPASSSSTSPTSPSQSLEDFLGPMITSLDGYPFGEMTERYAYRATVAPTGSSSWTPSRSSTTHPFCTAAQTPRKFTETVAAVRFEAPYYEIEGRHRRRLDRRACVARTSPRHDQAHRGQAAQRPVRALGARPSSASMTSSRCPGSTPAVRTRGASTRTRSGRTS